MDFLNSREIATLAWLTLLGLWINSKVKLWPLVLGIIRSFAKPIILRSMGCMAAYVALCVVFLANAHLWGWVNLKTTILWFLGFALPWMMDVKRFDDNPVDRMRRDLKALLDVTVIVTFVTEFYTFSIWVELLLVPAAIALGLLHAVSKGKPELKVPERVFGTLLAVLGYGLLVHAAYNLITDWKGFATPANARELFVAPVLSLVFIPFMYAFNVYAAYSIVFSTLKISVKDPGVRKWARGRAVREFGLDVGRLRRWKNALFRLDTNTKEDVRSVFELMSEASGRERTRPSVSATEGWSPYAAMDFLRGLGLSPRNYDPFMGGEWSSSCTKTIGDQVLPDTLAYYVRGTDKAATELKLVLNVINPDDEHSVEASSAAFDDSAVLLLSRVFGEAVQAVSEKLKRNRGRFSHGMVGVSLREEPALLAGRYSLKLTLKHRAHVEPFPEFEEVD